jgi:hypothetical protein
VLRDEHEHHAGHESEDGIEPEPFLPGEDRVAVIDAVGKKQQGQNGAAI